MAAPAVHRQTNSSTRPLVSLPNHHRHHHLTSLFQCATAQSHASLHIQPGEKKRRDESGRDEKGTPGETAVIRWWWDGVSNLASVYSVNILSAACFFDNFLFLFFFKNAQTISNGADCFERRAGVEGWSRGRGEGRGGGHSSANGSSLTLRSRSTLLNYDT